MKKHLDYASIKFYSTTRRTLFLARLYIYAFLYNMHFRMGKEFSFFTPGLEVKYACEAAVKNGANLEFMGTELDTSTW